MVAQTSDRAAAQRGYTIHRVEKGPSRDDLEAEAQDPYAMGWDAGNDLDDPPPCPFTTGEAARLWRNGFAARVDTYIARKRSAGGLHASLV